MSKTVTISDELYTFISSKFSEDPPFDTALRSLLNFAPTTEDLHKNGKNFPPNFLHESWMDYLYWDVELEN